MPALFATGRVCVGSSDGVAAVERREGQEMATDELVYLSAVELRQRYRARELSPVEVLTATLERIEAVNPGLNALVTVTPELAMAQAKSAERAYAGAWEPGPLAGIPISIKDLTPTKGIRTARGSLIDPDWVPTEDAPIVERLYAAGAVMLGKSNTPELGWKGDSGNRVFGPTHNPWRYGRTAGGSSGGGAAAVAAGMGPLAQGSDGAGSIRIPASFCGIVGHKPSFGLVPQYPASAVGDISHLGPMTRTVADAALMLTVIAGADARDRLSWSSGVDYLAALDHGIGGLRVAWSPDLDYATVDPEVRATTEAAARKFEAAGCVVEEVSLGLPNPQEIIKILWSSAMAGHFWGRLEAVRDLIDPGLLGVVEYGLSLSAAELTAAQGRRNAYWAGMRQFMERYDLLLTPTLPGTTFRAGADAPEPEQDQDVPLDWTPFTYPFNLTGQPAATVPCGFDRYGLPMGLQIVGRWRCDATVLRAAAAFEAIAPWAHQRPTLTDVPVVDVGKPV
jgi:aspartyl-tRNA(Asn)/glutamyl-tRNA(Gln) amidotransferase subunit A